MLIKYARLKDRVTHVKIHGRGKKYDVGGGKQFDSIEDLIEYYKKCLLVDDRGIAIYLYQVVIHVVITLYFILWSSTTYQRVHVYIVT